MKIWILAAAMCMGCLGAAAQGKKKEAPLFTVGQQPVFADEFIQVYQKNNSGKPDLFTEAKVDEYLTLYINFKLKVRAATDGRLDTTRAFQKEYATYRNELRKPFLPATDDLERLTAETYRRLEEEVNASHILLMVSPDASPADTLRVYERAMAVRNRLLAGEKFEDVARAVSEDPSAAVNGGNLGFFTALQMVFPFEDAAYRLAPGQLSYPVRTRFGYHLIQLNARQPARGEVEVSHILLRGTGPDVRNKALDIADQLKKGRTWNDLCRQYSEDATTRETGGRLRPFGVGALASVPQFEAVAFQLRQPGEISEPFASGIGWHIVRLEKKIPLPPYPEMQEALQRRVVRDERYLLAKAADLEKRKRTARYTENQQWLDSLRLRADTSLTNGTWKWKQPPWHNQPIATLAGKNIEVAQLAAHLKQRQQPSAQPPAAYFRQLYDQFVDEQLLEEEDRQLMASNAAYRALITEYREGMLMFSIMEQEVWNKAMTDTAGQRNHYNRNREKYRAGERVYARILAATSKGSIEQIKSRIEKGDTLKPEDLRTLKSVGSLRAYQRGEHTATDLAPWAAGLHEVEADGVFYLVEVERLLPPGIRPFSEVKAQVVADYQDELERQWLARLKQQYPVQVNKKVRKKVMAALVQKTA
jgi:peptidyl-prolyl cis-trans isomerase SurA